MARTVHCVYLKRDAEGLDFAPYPGELGKRIYASVSKEGWAAWLKHQTMLVNENRLNLADQRARQYLARQMENFFFAGGAEQPSGYVPPSTRIQPRIPRAAASRGAKLRRRDSAWRPSMN
jgi:Fe-S cluster biosynthesis and repair protein YggX